MNCTACGKELSFGSRFCSNCGHAVPPPPVPPAQPYAPYRSIVRPQYGRMLGGVCAGFAQHFGWDVALVRVLLVVIVFFGCGTPILAYFIAWIVIPNEPYSFPSDPYAQPYAQPYAPPAPTPAAPSNGPTV
jgi:phage shock protein C